MMVRTLSLALAFAAIATSACAQRAPAIYATHCAACHTPSRGAPVGDLAQRAPATFEAFARIVRNGESPSGEMPAFGADVLSDAELRALHAYINRHRPQR